VEKTPHIVEQLIAERAPHLQRSPVWPRLKLILYRLLAYDAAVFLADAVKPLKGQDAFALIADHLRVRTEVEGLDNVPASGPAIVIANHPTGLADGLAVFDAIRARRPDLCFLANADALRVIPHGDDIIIPVEWRAEKRTRAKSRQTLLDMKAAFEAGRLIVIFPSGRLAHMTWRGLTERPWESSAFMLARRNAVPLIPLHIRARNSGFFYAVSRISSELRDITLFRELLNKKRELFRMRFGAPIPPDALPSAAEAASDHVKTLLFRL
jgi:putative hemolysin